MKRLNVAKSSPQKKRHFESRRHAGSQTIYSVYFNISAVSTGNSFIALA